MKALVLEAPGDEPSLAVREVDPPTPGPHDVLVEVAACGFCYHDVAVMQGTLRRGVKPEPILGHEISGRVAETGGSVSLASAGDMVTSLLTTACGRCARCVGGREHRCLTGQGIGHAVDGGFAELVRLPETSLVPIPDGVEGEGACLLACPIGVAVRALHDVARAQEGETVLVTGAGGGLGVHAAQVAAAMGARVLAVTSSPEKVEPLEGLDVGEVILADELDFSEFALALTEDRGVDVVVNTVGAALFRQSFDSLAQFGRMVLLGEITGDDVRLRPPEVLFRDASIVGSTGANRRHVERAAEMVGSGQIRPVVSCTFGLEEAGKAFRLMRERKSFGRVVLVP